MRCAPPASARAAPRSTARSSRAATPAGPGPCAVAVADAGIAASSPRSRIRTRVVAGRGFAYLRERGIEVDGRRARGRGASAERGVRHHVVRGGGRSSSLKVAISLDGRDRRRAPGARTAITGDAAQPPRAARSRRGRRHRRRSGTLLADDPLLTARDVCRERPLTRVVFDSPPAHAAGGARLCGRSTPGRSLIVTTERACAAQADRARGAARGRGRRWCRSRITTSPARSRRCSARRHVAAARGRRRRCTRPPGTRASSTASAATSRRARSAEAGVPLARCRRRSRWPRSRRCARRAARRRRAAGGRCSPD